MNDYYLLRRAWERLRSPIDGWLLALIMALFALSLVVLFSASNQNLDKVINKMTFMLVALGIMWGVANVRPQTLMQLAVPGYIVGVLMLLGVALFGEVVNGSRRWLHVGVTRIQPSEVLKIMVPMMLAWYFQKHENALRWHHYLVGAVIIIIPSLFILKQPDLGTATLIMASGFFVLKQKV
jgi:rod shape determining protein RodA